MKYDGIILDVDGTIWDSTPVVADAWNHALKESGVKAEIITSETLRREFGKTMVEIAHNLFPSVADENLDPIFKLIHKYEHKYISGTKNKIEYDGVCETIEALSKKTNIFIVSNCQCGYIELVMSRLGIEKYIKDFECFCNTGKPKAENIKDVVKRNGLLSPVYVGDTQGDSDSCRDAGVPFIWAAYGFGKADNYVEKIDNFSELLKIEK